MFGLKPPADIHLTPVWSRATVLATCVLAFLGGTSAHAAVRARTTTNKRPASLNQKVELGVASWHEVTGAPVGGRTAGRKRWHNSELVAAHRTLPLGTKVRVVNLRNQRAVEVEITDRGPYARGRIIDLSVAAAIRLGMISDGTAKVRVEVVGAETVTAFSPVSALDTLVAMMFAPLPGWSYPVPAA